MSKSQPSHARINALIALYNTGRYVELESRARLLIGRHPNFGFGWKLLGGSLQMQGKNALPAFQRTAELMPDEADAHYNLGVALKGSGQLTDAAASYRRATKLRPDYAEAHYNLGNVLKELGLLDDAAASYRRAVEIKPNFSDALSNLGVVLKDLGHFDTATVNNRQASGSAEAYFNRGIALQDLGQLEDAVTNYRRALELKPSSVEAHFNMGIVFQELGRIDESAASYSQALEIKPDFAEAYINLGVLLQEQGRLDEAETNFRRAVEIKPGFAEAHCFLAVALKSKGNLSDARACYRKAQELGYPGAWVCEAVMLPVIMGTRQEVLESRAEFDSNLNKIITKRITLDDPLKSVGETNFFMAFHGFNDRDLQVKVANFYAQACPSLLYSAPHCAKPKPDHSKIRVGFLSMFLSSHSVSLCFSKLIEAISLTGQFEVALISNRHIDESFYSGVAGNRVYLPNDLPQARKILAALELDILVYLDIGMEPLSYFLAFSRLARAQCVLAGHPVTTGIANMDYFLSTDLMEPADADGHYSEKLVRLPRPPIYFARPTLPAVFKTRAELGLPVDWHIYMCPMKLQKLHPDFDAAITRILQLDDHGVVVLIEDDKFPNLKTALESRLDKTVPPDVRGRILFLPWLKEPADFMSAIASADVILDPFHFGIGSTAITTFATGTPIVTKAGEFMRGRVGMWLCKAMDLPECIAEDTEDYARKAVEIASDLAVRKAISAKMLKNNAALYENLQAVDDLIDFFDSLVSSWLTA